MGIKEKENNELVFSLLPYLESTLHIYIIYTDMSCFPKNRMANEGNMKYI